MIAVSLYKEAILAKSHYSYEKRRREMAKKKKKEEKRERKEAKKNPPAEENAEVSVPEGETPAE